MFKNVASQKIAVFAFDTTTGVPKTGDAANITAYVSKDYGAVTVLGDVTATEMDATNAKGWYLFDLTQAETNADACLFSGKSTTANISVVGSLVFTLPPNFTLESIDSNGRVDVIKIAGTTQTARDLGASVLLSSGVGAGQVSLSAGLVDVTQTAADKVWSTTTRALTDKIGFALSAAGNLAIWDIATSLLTTVGSIGKRLADFITGDAYARLGAPAGASTAADIAAVKVDTAAIKAKTDNLPVDPADESNTQAKLDTIIAYIDTEVASILSALTGANAEPATVPAANAPITTKIAWLYMQARNRRQTTSSQDKVFADDALTTVATAALSDDTTTFERGEYA